MLFEVTSSIPSLSCCARAKPSFLNVSAPRFARSATLQDNQLTQTHSSMHSGSYSITMKFSSSAGFSNPTFSLNSSFDRAKNSAPSLILSLIHIYKHRANVKRVVSAHFCLNDSFQFAFQGCCMLARVHNHRQDRRIAHAIHNSIRREHCFRFSFETK